MKKHYRKHLKKTPYKNTPLENDGLFNLIKNLSASVFARIKNFLHI